MEAPYRKGQSTKNGLEHYRFAFNGKEKDNEIKGIGNSLDFGARMEDTRLGIFLSIDPYASNFPGQSPYIFAGNSPIKFIDKDGKFQLDPVTAEAYPLIATYINTQIEADMMKNTLGIKAFKEINPLASDENIRNIYRPNSGPTLMSVNYPNSQNAGGYTTYNKDGSSTIEINTKVFAHVEKVLRDAKSSEKEKQVALMNLNVLIGHEVSGHEIGGYRGVDENGKDIKVAEKDMINKTGWSDAGYIWEYNVYGIEPGMTEEIKGRPDGPIKGTGTGNRKFKEGEMEKAHDRGVKNGGGTIPTIN